MADLNLDEGWDLLDIMMNERYQSDAVDFMVAWEAGTSEEMFPGSHDLVVLAAALDV
jgi:hypothetical protein